MDDISIDLLKCVDVLGHKMFVEPNDILQLSKNGVYESFETSIIQGKIQEGDIVLDIGANIGYYTLIAAKAVGSFGKVYAFEPDPYNFAILQKNVDMNGYDNVVLEQKAVSDKNERVILYLDKNSIVNHSLQRLSVSQHGVKIDVDAVRLDDDLEKDFKEVNFIKMDIQAGEWNALQGMKSLLKNDGLILAMEFWPKGLTNIKVNPMDCLDLLLGYGFSLFDIQEKSGNLEALDSLDKLNRVAKCFSTHTNLLCVKE